ncbi:MAG: hypothetical protein JXR96_18040 [Deltaproteobacteria bacterium]|nr:hypothetical protein [Deltaproteobacteria bacterium]
MKKALVVLFILALAAGGGFAFLHLTRVDRYLAALGENIDFDREMAAVLSQHAGEEKVQQGLVAAIRRRAQWGYVPQSLEPADYDFIEQACRSHPPKAEGEMIEIMARLNARHGDALKHCFPGFDQDPRITSAYLSLLKGEMMKADILTDGYENVVKEVVRRQPPVNRDLIDAMIHAAGTLNIHPADDYLDGLGADPHLSAGLDAFLLTTAKTKYNKGLAFLKEQYTRHPPAARPELADAVADMYVHWASPGAGESQEFIDSMRKALEELALAIPGAAEQIRKRADESPKDSGERRSLKQLVARIAPTDSEVIQLIADAGEYMEDPDRSAIDLKFEPNKRQNDALTALLRLSDEILPSLKSTFLSSYDWGKLQVCARVMAAKNPAMLAQATIDQLRNYEQLTRDAAKDIDQNFLRRYGLPAAAGLQALKPIKGKPEVDYAFMHALSSFDQRFAQYATEALRERLDRDRFVGALFAFLALKTSYSGYEVEVYEKALQSYPDSSAAIAVNLEKMLQAAGGKPDHVPWIHKVIAFRVLQKSGQPVARKAVEKYQGDPTGYSHVTFRVDEQGEHRDEHLHRISFADMVRATLKALDGRK